MAKEGIQPETIFGERGKQTAVAIMNLALRKVTAEELGPNFTVGAGGSIEVRFDQASLDVFANPSGHSTPDGQ